MSHFPFDPQARRRERIAAANARQAGAAAAQRQAAGAAANQAAVQEITALMAIADRMVVTPPGLLAAAVSNLEASKASVSRLRFELEGHIADRNATAIAGGRAQLAAAIERATFDHNRLVRLATQPLFTEPPEAPEAAAAPLAPPPVETVTPPVEVPASAPTPTEPVPTPAPADPVT